MARSVAHCACFWANVFSPGVRPGLPPSIQPFRFPSELSPGDTAVAVCVVRKGSAGPHSLTWTKDGKHTDHVSSPRISVSRQSDYVSTLTVRDITPRDNGNYTCHVENPTGNDEFSAFLAVEGRLSVCPDSPTGGLMG